VVTLYVRHEALIGVASVAAARSIAAVQRLAAVPVLVLLEVGLLTGPVAAPGLIARVQAHVAMHPTFVPSESGDFVCPVLASGLVAPERFLVGVSLQPVIGERAIKVTFEVAAGCLANQWAFGIFVVA
jgi:hypothetical protein